MRSNFEEAKFFVNHYRQIDKESLSGPGSTIKNTSEVRELIQTFLNKNNIKSILDLGCGDWNWFNLLNLDDASYLGWDADSDMINSNQINYGNTNVNFDAKDIVLEPYPQSDLIICRDVLFHMPIDMALHILNKIKKSCKYLISTSFREIDINVGIGDKNWGYYNINLNIDPFNLSKHEVSYKREMLGVSRRSISLCAKRFICLYKF